jgi:hypothetical protein
VTAAVVLSLAPGPGARAADAPPASDAALQQRIELLERQTATVKGRLAALEAAQRRLDARPSLEACAGFGGLAGGVAHEVAALARQFAEFGVLAQRYPERREAARLAHDAVKRLRDEVLGHAMTVVARCHALGGGVEAPLEPSAVALPITLGQALIAVGGSVVFWSGVEPEALGLPGGGLHAGRALAGAVDGLPEVLWVRVEGVTTDRAGLAASFLPGENAAGRSVMPQFVASPGALRGVVVLPFDGPLAETWALAGLARAFERGATTGAGCAPGGHRLEGGPMRFSAAQRALLGLPEVAGGASVGWTPAATSAGLAPSATCGESGHRRVGDAGPAVGLVVVTRNPVSDERMAEILADWLQFVTAGPDLDPTTSNFFEAAGGGTCRLASMHARPGGCTLGVPDLP